jgi:CRP/FNR family cyclic AMP-dependent transcriptional regulator
MVARSDLINAIQNIPWFLDLTSVQIDRLAGIASITTLAEGEILFREGDRENFMYIILEGQLSLDTYVPSQKTHCIYTADPLDILGWSSMTPVVRQRTASATAVSPLKLLRFDSVALRRMCDEDHDLGYLIMKRLANVVASQYLVNRLVLYDLIMKISQDQPVAAPDSTKKQV